MKNKIPVVRKTKTKRYKDEEDRKRKEVLKINKNKYEESKSDKLELEIDDFQKDQLQILRDMGKEIGLEVLIKGYRRTDKEMKELNEAELEKKKNLYNQYQRKMRFLRNSPYFKEYKEKLLTERQIVYLVTILNDPGNKQLALKRAGVKDGTVYLWKKENKFFAAELKGTDQVLIDYAMSGLIGNLKKGKEKSIFRVLDTIGASTGLGMIEEKNNEEVSRINTINLNSNGSNKKITLSPEEYREFLELKNDHIDKEEEDIEEAEVIDE